MLGMHVCMARKRGYVWHTDNKYTDMGAYRRGCRLFLKQGFVELVFRFAMVLN